MVLAQRQDPKPWSFRLSSYIKLDLKLVVEVLVALGGTWLYLKGRELSLHHSQHQRGSR